MSNKVKQYIILNTSRKHVNYEEDKNKVPMNKQHKKKNLFTVLVWFFVNFARKVSLEIFDKSRPK
jgi:hypothetical protein